MKVNKSRIIKAAVLFLGLFAFDLLTKSLAVNALQDGRHIPLISGVLEFYYIQNRGAAFGIFQNGTFILGIISTVALVVLIFVYLKIPDGKKYLPLRLVLIFIAAGDAGNLYDRVTLQYVSDFIFSWIQCRRYLCNLFGLHSRVSDPFLLQRRGSAV